MRRFVARVGAMLSRGRTQVTHVKTVPAPVGGWNARDPLAAMKPLDAIILENWFPRVADCTIRGGNTNHLTGMAARGKTLALYTPPTGSNKMFVSTDAGVYDATSAGAVGAAVAACTNGLWNWTQMGVSGGHYLLMFNGTDSPLYFDGTNWIVITGVSVPAITGLTPNTIILGAVHKRRLFFVQANKLSFWYLAADAVGGAAAEFLLGPLCPKGGYLMAIANWSFDGGAGPDDFAVFITSEGEVVIFKGSNPADSTDWLLVGTYFIGKPLGRRCVIKYGGDVVVITQFGAFPLSKALQSQAIDYREALTDKIQGAFVDASRSYAANVGWEGIILPIQSAFLFNVPIASGGTSAEQYVMNTTTKSWCKFTGWNASCFAVLNGELYYADSNRVAKAWTTQADVGANIIATGETAYNNFGTSQEKEWKLIRPMFLVDGPLSFSVGLSVDFNQNVTLSAATYTTVAGATWDTSLWDVGMWAAGLEIRKDWRTPSAQAGVWAAAIVKVATNSLEVHWVTQDYVYEVGGVVG